jgi:hypothetical protein
MSKSNEAAISVAGLLIGQVQQLELDNSPDSGQTRR